MVNDLFTNINSWLGNTSQHARGMWVEIKKGTIKGTIKWINRKDYKFFNHNGRLQSVFGIMKNQLSQLPNLSDISVTNINNLISLKKQVTIKFTNYQKAHSAFIFGFFYRLLFGYSLNKHYQAIINNLDNCLKKHVSKLPLNDFKEIIKKIRLSQIDLNGLNDEQKSCLFDENLAKFNELDDSQQTILYKNITNMSNNQIKILLEKGLLRNIDIKSLDENKQKFIISTFLNNFPEIKGNYDLQDLALDLKVLFLCTDLMTEDQFRIFIRRYDVDKTTTFTPQQILICLEEYKFYVSRLEENELFRIIDILPKNYFCDLNSDSVKKLNLSTLSPDTICNLCDKINQEQVDALDFSKWSAENILRLYSVSNKVLLSLNSLNLNKCTQTINFDGWSCEDIVKIIKAVDAQNINYLKLSAYFFKILIQNNYSYYYFNNLNLKVIDYKNWSPADKQYIFAHLPIENLSIEAVFDNFNYFPEEAFSRFSLEQLNQISFNHLSTQQITKLLNQLDFYSVQILAKTINNNISKIENFSKFSHENIKLLNFNILSLIQIKNLVKQFPYLVDNNGIKELSLSRFSKTEIQDLLTVIALTKFDNIASVLNKLPTHLYPQLGTHQCANIDYATLDVNLRKYFTIEQIKVMKSYADSIEHKIDDTLNSSFIHSTDREFLRKNLSKMTIQQFKKFIKIEPLKSFVLGILTTEQQKAIFEEYSSPLRILNQNDVDSLCHIAKKIPEETFKAFINNINSTCYIPYGWFLYPQMAWAIEIKSHLPGFEYLKFDRLIASNAFNELDQLTPFLSITWLQNQSQETIGKLNINRMTPAQVIAINLSLSAAYKNNLTFTGWKTSDILTFYQNEYQSLTCTKRINFNNWRDNELLTFITNNPLQIIHMNWEERLFLSAIRLSYKFDPANICSIDRRFWSPGANKSYYQHVSTLEYLSSKVIEEDFKFIPENKLRTMKALQISSLSLTNFTDENILTLTRNLDEMQVSYISPQVLRMNIDKILDFSKFTPLQLDALTFTKLTKAEILDLSFRKASLIGFPNMGELDLTRFSVEEVVRIRCFVQNFTGVGTNLNKIPLDLYSSISDGECRKIDYLRLTTEQQSAFTEVQKELMNNYPKSRSNSSSSSSYRSHSTGHSTGMPSSSSAKKTASVPNYTSAEQLRTAKPKTPQWTAFITNLNDAVLLLRSNIPFESPGRKEHNDLRKLIIEKAYNLNPEDLCNKNTFGKRSVPFHTDKITTLDQCSQDEARVIYLLLVAAKDLEVSV